MDIPPGGPASVPLQTHDLNAKLAEIQTQIDRATSAYQPNLLTQAGDVCAQAGDKARALAYYGQAIDGYMVGGRDHAASAVCRKILQLSPTSVRARCTLAWLAFARQDTRHAIIEMQNYVKAARAAGQAQLATKQLVLLAKAASSQLVLEAIGMELLTLERSEESEAVLRFLYAGGDKQGALESASADIWAQAHYAVKLTPYDLAAQNAGAAASPARPAKSATLAEVLRKDPTTPAALREVLARLESAKA